MDCFWLAGLLSNVLVTPIHLNSINIGPVCSTVKLDETHIIKSLSRIKPMTAKLNILESQIFDYSPMALTKKINSDAREKSKNKVVPCSTASLWFTGMTKIEQIDGRNGIKLGTGKKQIHNQKNHSIFSKKKIFQFYKEIFELPSDAKYLDCKEEKYKKSKMSVELKWTHHNPERDNFI